MSEELIPARRWCQRGQAGYLAVGAIGWCLFTFGCVPSKVQVQSAPQFDASAISSIAIVPFQSLKSPQWGYDGQSRGGLRDPEEIRTQFRLPGTDQVRRSDSQRDLYTVPETATQSITTRVESILRARPTLRVIGVDARDFSASLGDEPSSASLKTLAKEVGDRLKVDGVLMGLVRTFREREGTRIGAKPAAVGFEIFLIRPSDGTVLWKGEFFEEQKPLNQDFVGFFEKSGGFVTAQELSELGVQKVMKAFPVGQVAPITE